MKVLLAVLVLTVAAGAGQGQGVAPGADKPEYETPAWPATSTSNQLILRLVLLTGGTLGCAFGVLWLARRAQQVPLLSQEMKAPRVVASVSLGGRNTLHLLQVDEAGFIVATDPGGLKAIHVLAEPFEELVENELGEESTEPCSLAPRRVG